MDDRRSRVSAVTLPDGSGTSHATPAARRPATEESGKPLARSLARHRTAWLLSGCAVVMVTGSILAAGSIGRSRVLPPPLTFTAGLRFMSFRVVGPDGSPVPHPFVVVTVVGDSRWGEHIQTGGPDGEVEVQFPDYDPNVARRVAHGEVVTLLIRVTERAPRPGGPPGAAEGNSVAVGAAFGKDPVSGVFREMFGPSGHVLMLTPGGDRRPPRVVI